MCKFLFFHMNNFSTLLQITNSWKKCRKKCSKTDPYSTYSICFFPWQNLDVMRDLVPHFVIHIWGRANNPVIYKHICIKNSGFKTFLNFPYMYSKITKGQFQVFPSRQDRKTNSFVCFCGKVTSRSTDL